MKILFPTAECVPFAKTGGLADVCGALPLALADLGHEVHVVMPFYRQVQTSTHPVQPAKLTLSVPVGGRNHDCEVWKTKLAEKVTVYFLGHNEFFQRAGLYGTLEGDYPDNDQRFVFFGRAVMELGKSLGIVWDILHCHDWHTGLIPVYAKTLYRDEKSFAKTKSLMTIHNLGYQGVFPDTSMALTGLPPELFHPDALEFWGRLNFFKAGLVFADWISTVSTTYAQEIQTEWAGHGLDGVLRARREVVSGITNGIDCGLWNPETDSLLEHPFSAAKLAPKNQAKTSLAASQGLYPVGQEPLLGLISRLDDQKGLDILAEAMEKLMQLPLLMVVLGTGAKKYHDLFLRFKARYPRKLAINLTFNNTLSHQIYAASDFFLMPSKYEPCGLGQMISMRYGSIPVVRRTGGLADTVLDFDGKAGNGFVFDAYQSEALLAAVKRALAAYEDKPAWRRLVKRAMLTDFSWEKSAQAYVELYEKMAPQSPKSVSRPQPPAPASTPRKKVSAAR